MIELTVIFREGCHLCDVMLAQLAALQAELGVHIHPVDVDGDADLTEDYGVLVPVLLLEDREICHYHLDEAALRQALADGGHPAA